MADYEVNLSDENGQRDEAAVLGVDEGAPQQTDLTRDTHSLDQHLPESGSTQITASLLDNDQCSPQVYADRAKEYKIWAQITIVASVIFCFFPFSFICLVLAYFSGEETTKRNDEEDYLSARACGIWTLVWSITAIVWGGMWGIGFIAFLAGILS